MTRYGGFKHAIDQYKLLKDQLDKAEPSEQTNIAIKLNQLGYMPPWLLQLEWPEAFKLPKPIKEITREEWMLAGLLSVSSCHEQYYQSLNIVGEPEWFGGWPCHIDIYYEYALVVAHMNFSPRTHGERMPILGKGEIVKQSQYTSYVVRYFRIGCSHEWKQTLSRMCYREYVCTKCGLTRAEDSSD